MRVTSGSDWRDSIPFETPLLLADIAPGGPARCVACGVAADPLERDRLWVVKHRHPNDHGGFVRFYCADHAPAAAATVAGPAPDAVRAKRAATPRAPRAPRPTPVAERPRPVCPDCFVEVPPTGRCGVCGTMVA
ncbi:glucose-6-phosphate dehydrogenase [Microbacterium sp.]|uniref:glucose-6-phosphate dehydrogenase n=1 Tax=Microbacterium sp. TaxID=51671 RepID=UPI00092ABDF0|nr:glucose-6-phosphate dehydrogenase [Microbacterium sp.]MBN9187753.1 glucose-6-phosphate dehydrogenase [Microbacterium sp.]MBN9194428.1 glucose-6-phosphate dehydrogenase [Microbacterium sp.]OJU71905.1 MAG: glucose-6-phosphate dehydrogenase [Microbacterium sp. 70-38]